MKFSTLIALVLATALCFSAAEHCTFDNAEELRSAISAPDVVVEPELIDSEAVVTMFASGDQDCFETEAYARVGDNRCSIRVETLGNSTFELTIDEQDLIDCGADVQLSSDNRFIVLECELIFEFSFKGKVGRTFIEFFQFRKNRLTAAVTGIFTPFEEEGETKSVTDNTLIEAELTTCVDADCEDTSAIIYLAGDIVYAQLTIDISGFTCNVRSVVLGEFSSSREVDLTDSLDNEDKFDGGVRFSVILEECTDCFIRVIAEVEPLDGTDTATVVEGEGRFGAAGGRGRGEGEEASGDLADLIRNIIECACSKASAFREITIRAKDETPENPAAAGADNTAVIAGASAAGGVVVLGAVVAVAVVASKKRKARKAAAAGNRGNSAANERV